DGCRVGGPDGVLVGGGDGGVGVTVAVGVDTDLDQHLLPGALDRGRDLADCALAGGFVGGQDLFTGLELADGFARAIGQDHAGVGGEGVANVAAGCVSSLGG